MEVFSPELLIARLCMRVYNRSMVRKCASFAFGLALIVALGFAMVHALKIPGAFTGFSTPCEPPSAMFKAADELKPLSTHAAPYSAQKPERSSGLLAKS